MLFLIRNNSESGLKNYLWWLGNKFDLYKHELYMFVFQIPVINLKS